MKILFCNILLLITTIINASPDIEDNSSEITTEDGTAETADIIQKILASENLNELRGDDGKLILSLLPPKCRDELITQAGSLTKYSSTEIPQSGNITEPKTNDKTDIPPPPSNDQVEVHSETNSTIITESKFDETKIPTPVESIQEEIPQIEIQSTQASHLNEELKNYQFRLNWLRNPYMTPANITNFLYAPYRPDGIYNSFKTEQNKFEQQNKVEIEKPIVYNTKPYLFPYIDRPELHRVQNALREYKIEVQKKYPHFITHIPLEYIDLPPNSPVRLFIGERGIMFMERNHSAEHRYPVPDPIMPEPWITVSPVVTESPPTTMTTVSKTVLPPIVPGEPLYDSQLRFVVPVVLSKKGTAPIGLDPYAYLPPQVRPSQVQVPIPYKPVYHMIRTLTYPTKN